MPFIGNKPSAVPLTSADITDNIIVNADINTSAGITTEKLSLISTASVASVTAKGTPSVSDGYIQLNCEQNSHGIKIKSPPHSAGANYTLVMPSATGTSLQVLRMNSGATALEFATPTSATNTPNFAATVGSFHNILNLTTTAVQFNTEVFDTNSSFDTSTYRFTVPSGSAGKYLITVSIRFQAFSSNRKEINLYKNGSNFFSFENAGTGGGQYDLVSGSIVMNLAVADYIQMFAYQDSGSTQQIRDDSFFQAFKLIE